MSLLIRPRMRAALAMLLLSASLGAEYLPVKAYTIADGLMSDGEIMHMIQDSRGYLWICGALGISAALAGGGLINDSLGWRFAFYAGGLPGLALSALVVPWTTQPQQLCEMWPMATRWRKASGQVTGWPRPATRSAASLRRPGSASRAANPAAG